MILLGLNTSGFIHFGNYISTIKPAICYKKKISFLADLHGLCKNLKLNILLKNKIIMISVLFSFFKDIFFYQSYNNNFLKFFWLLLCFYKKNKVKFFHSLKKNEKNSLSKICYPLLMISDIYTLNNKYIFAGVDQLQHIELYKKIIKKINFYIGKKIIFKNNFIINNKILYSFDKKKMSKTNKNDLFIFSNFKEIILFLNKFKNTKKKKKSLFNFSFNLINFKFIKNFFFQNKKKIFLIKISEIIYYKFLPYKKKFLINLKLIKNIIKKLNYNNIYLNNILNYNIENIYNYIGL
ncbi:hypothetical protein ACJEC8_00515 [Candidatus Carsonella ruddii]|uniref:hypothetical protein n=1 Tax=Carsonella ruddii TaxID=114186 RepID=UPI003D4A023A